MLHVPIQYLSTADEDLCVVSESDLADVGHLSWFVSSLHVPEEGRLTAKIQLTDLTRCCTETNQLLQHNAGECLNVVTSNTTVM